MGMGLLGASITLAISRGGLSIKTVGYSHREETRGRSRELGVATVIAETLEECVREADIVILATPIRIFEGLFREISGWLKPGCIVTDVGSTKTEVHRWAAKSLNREVYYVGSHPIAGSEKRGVEFARDDLLVGARCILTQVASTHKPSLDLLDSFWRSLGAKTIVMSPRQHDRIYAMVSHVPHVTAAALVNATGADSMPFAGKGFIDTSRVASGPSNIWMDILLSNPENISKGVGRVIKELEKIREAVDNHDEAAIERLLEKARKRRSDLIEYKVRNKELF